MRRIILALKTLHNVRFGKQKVHLKIKNNLNLFLTAYQVFASKLTNYFCFILNIKYNTVVEKVEAYSCYELTEVG